MVGAVRRHFFAGIAAGLLVGIGGAVFLACESRVAGAVLFSVALLAICLLGLSLFTGKVGYLVASHEKADWQGVLSALAGNAAGAVLCALLVAWGKNEAAQAARALCAGKLDRPLLSALPGGFLCGVLMYAAVQTYRTKNTCLGILFCIPAFILAGFEHSIADMFYFALAALGGLPGSGAAPFLLLVIAGNALGGCFLPALEKLSGGERS